MSARTARTAIQVDAKGLAHTTAANCDRSTAGPSPSMSEVISPTQAGLREVDTDDGPVTVTTIEHLEEISVQKQSDLKQMADEVKNLDGETARIEVEAGRALTDRSSVWPSTGRMPRIEAAQGLERLVSNLENTIAETAARPHHGIGGLIHGLSDKHEVAELNSQLASARSELNNRYRAVADGLEPSTGLAEVDTLLAQLASKRLEITDLTVKLQQVNAELKRLTDELNQRKEVQANLGFDALGLQADLVANGLRPIAVNLVLKPKEIAVASSQATLCRYKTRTQYVGGSQGLSIPLGHGFRYRISSFRGHPIQTDVLSQLDQGTLVITNQRLVFLGTKRDVSTPVAKLLQVEPFSNGIAVSREGKESRDIYLLPRPAYPLLYLQWVVSHQ
jgi:hypothetical protein